MKYVIIGNSIAAVGCVEGIRRRDPDSPITIVGKEPYSVYSRPLISYLLKGATDEQRMKYRPDSFYADNGVSLRAGRTAERLDPQKKLVYLDGGEALPYDRLLVATGSVPFVPPMAGLDAVRDKCSFMTLDDAHALAKLLAPDKEVLILGAGLIGLKCAEGIVARVKKVTCVDLAPRILPSVLDEEGAAMVQRHLEAHGLSFRLGDAVERFENGDTAVLRSGASLRFDILVVAVGVRACTGLVQDAGGAVARGIRTDDHCRTTLPDVYAAGDCCESHDITIDADRVLALLPNAYMGGEIAGLNMAGGDKAFDFAMPLNAVGFFGLSITTAGDCSAGETYIVRGERSYKKLVWRDDLLRGFILVGNIERAGIYTSLVRRRTPLSSVDFDLIKDKPQLMAFTKEVRAQELGGKK